MKKGLLNRRDPIVLLGIHRSGTSLLGELLTDIGVFMGRKMNAHHEAWHFLDNNKKILDIAHADWDIPLVFEYLLKSEPTSEAVIDILQKETSKRKMMRHFFGGRISLRETVIPNGHMWGWKDPRTSLTFPLWGKIFPDARYIMVVRNGVDVANSMKVREESKTRRIDSRATSARCQSLEEAFRVWEEYNEFFYRYKDQIPEDKLLVIRYEDILTNSLEVLRQIAEFIGLKEPSLFVEKASRRIDPGKAFRYRNNEHLTGFYNQVKDSHWMKEFGY